MRGFSHFCLAAVLATLLMLAGCSGSTKDDPIKKQPVPQPDQKQVVKNETSPQPLISNVPVVPVLASIEKIPTEKEPAGDPADSWDEKMFSDSDWKKIKEIYVARYLRQPEYLLWAVKQPIPAKSANLLQKGYSMFWNSAAEESPKELEYGLLSARLKIEADMEGELVGLEGQGKGGKEHLLLSYIACWYYCLNGKNDKAKMLARDLEMMRGIEEFQIAIPKDHLVALQAEMNKLPTVVKKVEPVKKEEPKKEEPKKVEPAKTEEPKKEEPKKEEPKQEEPAKTEDGDKPKDNKQPDEEEGWDSGNN